MTETPQETKPAEATAPPPAGDEVPTAVAQPAPKETAPKDAAPKETAPKEAAPKEAAPKDAAPKEAAPKETAPKEAAAKKAAAKETAPKDAAAKETAPKGKPPDGHWWWGLGRRKSAVARVRIRPGEGKFVINKRPYDNYFNEERDRSDLLNVLRKTNTFRAVDVYVNVNGGGFTGQAGAIILGLGRALLRYDSTLEPILRDNGFLTRDPRKVERKKYGQPGARKRFQVSKR